MVPVVGVQVIANLRSVVAAAATVTDRGLVPCALQFPARSASSTWWTPAARLLRMVSALTAIGWLVPASTLKLYPFASASGPLVVVMTRRLPTSEGGATQPMVYPTLVFSPPAMVTVRALSPWIWQLAASPFSPRR